MLSGLYKEIYGRNNDPVSMIEPGEEGLDKVAAASVELFNEFDKLGRLIAREYTAGVLRKIYGV